MRHSGKARKAAFNMLFWTLAVMLVLFVAGFVATILGPLLSVISGLLIILWFF